MKKVLPKVSIIGSTSINRDALLDYLLSIGAEEFIDEWDGCTLPDWLKICSFYAKLCYKSLVLGMNENVTKIRGIEDNIQNCIDVGHGSVFEHASINMVIEDCSRIFTHELVRHRVGTAFSQESGRYCVPEELKMVIDPRIDSAILDEVLAGIERDYLALKAMFLDPGVPFAEKKAITSALRRMLPNGMANTIGFTVNLRELRHIMVMRTNRGAEWEMRYVFNQVYGLLKDTGLFYGLNHETVDGLVELSVQLQS